MARSPATVEVEIKPSITVPDLGPATLIIGPDYRALMATENEARLFDDALDEILTMLGLYETHQITSMAIGLVPKP